MNASSQPAVSSPIGSCSLRSVHFDVEERYRPGLVICSKYRLDALLGEGGMGAVWQATNLDLECPVALKLIRGEADHEELRVRLQLEARVSANLTHPGIVRVFDVGVTDSEDPFIVMELLRGKTLTQRSQSRPLTPAEAVRVLLPVVDALSLAHSNGIVHRDLKPDNIFLVEDGRTVQPKVLDFGVAKCTTSTTAITQAGTLIGTPDYMAPEAARGSGGIDARADIWSLCVVLYEQLSGVLPFRGNNANVVLCAIVEREPEPLPTHFDGGPELWRILQRGLAKQPEDRFQTMSELSDALCAWLATYSGSTIPSPQQRASRFRPARSKLPWLAMSALCLLTPLAIWLGTASAPHRARAAEAADAKPAPPRTLSGTSASGTSAAADAPAEKATVRVEPPPRTAAVRSGRAPARSSAPTPATAVIPSMHAELATRSAAPARVSRPPAPSDLIAPY